MGVASWENIIHAQCACAISDEEIVKPEIWTRASAHLDRVLN